MSVRFTLVLRFAGFPIRAIMLTLAGNSKGLLLPNSTTDQEMLHIRNSLPEKIVVQVPSSFSVTVASSSDPLLPISES